MESAANYRIISIDPGSSCCGFAVLSLNMETLELTVESAYTVLAKDLLREKRAFAIEHGEKDARLWGYTEHLTKMFEWVQPEALCYETAYFRRFPTPFAVLKEICMLFRFAAWQYNRFMPVNGFVPSEVKKNIGAKVSKDKDLMTKALRKRKEIKYDTSIDFDSLDEHSIDAICVGLCHIDRVKEKLEK